MNIDNLKGHIPDFLFEQIPNILTFGIDGPKRLSHFLGQCKHETGGFKVFVENLNYSADRLTIVFNKYFKTLEDTKAYARNPEKIANKVYANRMGNSDESSGDGWNFRGRGALQTTGKSNYKALGDFLKIDLIKNPDLVATKYSLASAAFFFKNNNIWSICDQGVDDKTITLVTKKVNGGTHGLEERIKYTKEFYKLLN